MTFKKSNYKKSMANLLAAFRKGQVNILYKDDLSAVAISKALQIYHEQRFEIG